MPIIDEKERTILTEEEKKILKKAEEIKLKMAMAEQEERTSDVNSSYEVIPHEKLLPFLNAKAQYHTNRLETLHEKRDTLTAKIEKNQAKIEKLTAKAERLEDMNKMLSAIAPNIPGVKDFIERNENKIKAIREVKIPNRLDKITAHKARIAEIDKKTEIITNKLNRCVALNEAIKSFALIGGERRKSFARAMDNLNEYTYYCVQDKYDLLQETITNNPEKAEKLAPKLEKLGNKINKLRLLAPTYARLNDNQIDKAMENTAEVINDNMENGCNMPTLAENITDKNIEDKDLHDIDELNKLKKEYPFLSKISTMIANLENEVNNLKKTVSNQKQTENSEPEKGQEYNGKLPDSNITISAQKSEEKSLEQTKERPKLYTQSFDYAQKNGEVKEFQASYKENMNCLWDIKATAEIYAAEGKLDSFLKDLTEKYGTERPLYVLSRTVQAVDDMRFSPETKQIANRFEYPDKGSVHSFTHHYVTNLNPTVIDNMMYKLNEMQHNLEKAPEIKEYTGKLPDRNITIKEKQNQSEIINPDYYKSIAPDERIRSTYSKAAGEKLLENLKNSNIPYSAAINNEKGRITITVSKENENTFNELKQQLSRQRIQSYNPEYFESLPKDKRFVQTGLTEQEVKNLKTDLDKQGIKCSFIQNGDNSKITISKDDTHKLDDKTKSALFGRNAGKSVNEKIEAQNKNKEKTVNTRSRTQQEL
ncbi:MAG: DUF3849 domain-containing protein [Hominimerdicola sp.]